MKKGAGIESFDSEDCTLYALLYMRCSKGYIKFGTVFWSKKNTGTDRVRLKN